jgi:hypothetical protein
MHNNSKIQPLAVRVLASGASDFAGLKEVGRL